MITFMWHYGKGKNQRDTKHQNLSGSWQWGGRLTTKGHERISLDDRNILYLIVMVLT